MGEASRPVVRRMCRGAEMTSLRWTLRFDRARWASFVAISLLTLSAYAADSHAADSRTDDSRAADSRAAESRGASLRSPASSAGIPRLPNGKPDFSGIWQTTSAAEYDLEPHSGRKDAPPS